MTNEELFQDLKQFIAATVSQQIAVVTTNMATKDDLQRLEAKLEAKIDDLDEKLDHVQDAIAETFTTTAKLTNATLQDHEQRLHRLEHHAA